MTYLVKYLILMSSTQCENAFPMFLFFCWAKMFSKRYRSNKDSVKIMFWWFFHVLFRDFSCFLICFVTTGWFPKRWANLQTRAKLGSPQNTPNTVFKRPSKLIISMIFDDFYGFNQTFWCSIVGVFLIETHTKNKIFGIVFKWFLYGKTFLFSEKSWFSWWTVFGDLQYFTFLFLKIHS